MATKVYWLLNENGQAYPSLHPGAFGGHRDRKLYGRLNCRSALRAIAHGGYVSGRVFFAEEATARAAGYRPCAVCMPIEYQQWKIDRLDLLGADGSHEKIALGPVCAVSSAELHQLGRDNARLSRPRNENENLLQTIVSNRKEAAVEHCRETGRTVADYVSAGIAPATRRAYRSDLDHFRAWGGEVPATEIELAAYIAQYATALKPATLTRRIAALSIAHERAGLANPARSPLIRATLRGIRREHGAAQRQATPLLRDDLVATLDRTGNSLKDVRDRALLLIGFAGAFRRSELVGLDFADFERVRQGIVIYLRRSKTDQAGAGRKIAVPLGRFKWCPVEAVERWFLMAGVNCGPAFRRVNRHGHVAEERLSPEAVCLVLRERVVAAGYDPSGFSGHSLRSGFVTSAAQCGVSSWRIRQQTGHASEAMLERYIRNADLFFENPAGALL